MDRPLFVVLAFALAGSGASSARAQTARAPAVEAQLAAGEESDPLAALRAWEERAFRRGGRPVALGSGEPPDSGPGEEPVEPPPPVAEIDLTYLRGARHPDLPMRWDERVVTYLEHFRSDARGRALMTGWLRRSTRWDAVIREALRAEGLPEDLRCVALAESGFDPTVRSPVGALGMWQFVPVTGAEYGLTQTHWVDERMDPYASTRAAARYLGDLHRRLGSWELALAAYNMGYGALLRAIRKYNSNDYGLLSTIEAGLPFETTIYVSKILACGMVMRNPERFGFGEVTRDAAVRARPIEIPPGTSLDEVARVAGVDARELRALNPHILRGRTPPGVAAYPVRIPEPAAATFAQRWAQRRPEQAAHVSAFLRQGESLAELARRYRTTEEALRSLNEIDATTEIVPGTAMLVPNVRPRATPRPEQRVIVAVPRASFAYTDRRRVFYRVVTGDTIERLTRFFRVTAEEIAQWNSVDAAARLHAGMVLSLYVPPAVDLERAVVLDERDVRVLVVGSDEFFDHHERERGRVRVRYRIQTGDTLVTIGQRFGLTTGDLMRINQIRRDARLRAGDHLIVYTSPDLAATMEAAPLETSPPAEVRTTPPPEDDANATENAVPDATPTPSAVP